MLATLTRPDPPVISEFDGALDDHLFKDFRPVGFHRPDGDPQIFGDHLVQLARLDHHHDFLLARRHCRHALADRAALGVHPVHLGILMAVNMEVGLCHPPVGLNLYVASGITKMGITELTIAVLPWLMTMIAFLVLITYVPEISLWLPRTLGML